MVQENNNVKGNSSNLQIPDVTFVDVRNGNCISSGDRNLTREKWSLRKVLQMHQQLQASNEENRKLMRKKILVLQSYSNSKSLIPTSTILENKCKEKKFFLRHTTFMVWYQLCSSVFRLAYVQFTIRERYSHRSTRIEVWKKFTEKCILLEVAGPEENASVAALS